MKFALKLFCLIFMLTSFKAALNHGTDNCSYITMIKNSAIASAVGGVGGFFLPYVIAVATISSLQVQAAKGDIWAWEMRNSRNFVNNAGDMAAAISLYTALAGAGIGFLLSINATKNLCK